jgi:hypothetical protein
MLKLALALPLCLVACKSSSTSSEQGDPEGSEKLNVPDGNQLAFELHATGVQIYVCKPRKDDTAQFEWAFLAPSASLIDSGEEIGHHYGGPTWNSRDGSWVIGKLEQKVDAPEETDIPWLLLSAKSHAGSGQFEHVSFIQRVHTKGGKAPAEGCDAEHVGQQVRVEYQATYRFYVPES